MRRRPSIALATCVVVERAAVLSRQLREIGRRDAQELGHRAVASSRQAMTAGAVGPVERSAVGPSGLRRGRHQASHDQGGYAMRHRAPAWVRIECARWTHGPPSSPLARLVPVRAPPGTTARPEPPEDMARSWPKAAGGTRRSREFPAARGKSLLRMSVPAPRSPLPVAGRRSPVARSRLPVPGSAIWHTPADTARSFFRRAGS